MNWKNLSCGEIENEATGQKGDPKCAQIRIKDIKKLCKELPPGMAELAITVTIKFLAYIETLLKDDEGKTM